MDKLHTIENIIKYMPFPAFVARDGEIVLRNEQGKNFGSPNIKDKLLSVQSDDKTVMWDEKIDSRRCSLLAWRAEEFCIITVSCTEDNYSAIARKISHAIREPLSGIHAGAKIIMNRLGDDPESDEYCAAMAQDLYRVMRLMGNLDTLAGAEKYDLKAKAQYTDVKELICSLVDNAKFFVLEKKVECILPSNPVLTMADSVLLEVALGNLIENALKYSCAGARITVKLECIGSNIIISVKDDGQGMSTGKLQSIASMNFAWQEHEDMLSASAGMGLLIAKFAAGAHGGSMMIESREGEGTNVILTVPVKKTDSLNLSAGKMSFKPDFLSPLAMFSDILPKDAYMFLDL